jgi:NAD(P)-dependent dehydrogenase (short-subunit alcohol dehydrogenase family)
MTHDASKDDLRVSTLFNFSNHVALVTGGATGLGEMAAQAFVQNGARVFIASRKESELRLTTERLNKLGPGRCEYVVADLKDRAGCDALCAEVRRRTDRLTVLVNNTGATWGDDYYDFPEHAWDKLMALNVKSIFYMTVGLEPLLLKGATPDTPGRVINIASMAGIQTRDVTTPESGGLSKPGHGTFSCMSDTPTITFVAFVLESLFAIADEAFQMAPLKRPAFTSPKCKPRNSHPKTSWSTSSALACSPHE